MTLSASDKQPIYLDYNATTPLLPEVVDSMLPYLREHFGNPSSSHDVGRAARAAVETAREQVAALLGCDADEVVFTSGGTEANNLAIRGVTQGQPTRRRVVTSQIEHPAVAASCAWLESQGWHVTRASVDTEGRIRADELVAAIDTQTALVTVMHANNETGVLQPLGGLAETAHAAAVLHTDAAQSIGKIPVSVRELGVDLLSVAGHKLYGPKGVGALYIRRGVPLVPFQRGEPRARDQARDRERRIDRRPGRGLRACSPGCGRGRLPSPCPARSALAGIAGPDPQAGAQRARHGALTEHPEPPLSWRLRERAPCRHS